MDDLATDVSTLVESFFGDVADQCGGSMSVPMDIDESDGEYVLTLDVPGVPLESIEIDVHEDRVSIAGERVATSTPEASDEPENLDDADQKPTVHRRRTERPAGKFERRLRLPKAIEHDSVAAELSDGVLVVTIPKADPEKGKRRVPVSRS